ncbi:hypothetical protein K440DRAFT_250228 [Wilcoxina mikolae CBS 423.85]|nr:hypothetical protein K440DRAFT_250228 [Wilcoxina mikolae CBS 423.85]
MLNNPATTPKFVLFFKIAIPLTLITIVLPLTAENLVRLLVNMVRLLKKLNGVFLLRFGLDVPMFAVFLFSIFVNEVFTIGWIYLVGLGLLQLYNRIVNSRTVLKEGGWSAVRENFGAHEWPEYLDFTVTLVFIIVWANVWNTIGLCISTCLFFIFRLARQLYPIWLSRKKNY